MLRLLSRETSTPMGQEHALELEPRTDPAAVRQALADTRQARQAVADAGPPPWGTVPDLRPVLDRAEKPGSTLEGSELAAFIPFLAGVARLRGYGNRVAALAPDVGRRFSRLPNFAALAEHLVQSLTEDGGLKDDASPRLRKLRQAIRELRRDIVKRLEAFFALPEADTLFQDRFVTLRRGRYVLPVRAEARARVRGLVHDRSQTGATWFVEPEAVVEANNELTETLREEEAESFRILAALTDEVRACLAELRGAVAEITELDLIAARARLAERMEATEPELDPGRRLELQGVRHPLLLARSWQEPSCPVVPVDLELSAERPLLVVTGPNAGGKTVALKCLGLSVLMAQAGLHLPAREGSRLPVFSRLFAVVGDEQSVAENLSTFSAFAKEVRTILEEADAGALVLLDELGAGTDPDEGAALAQAILEELESHGALVMATTHLEPLKAFAATHPTAQNASVEFDAERLAPTYRLAYGRPGQSYALTIGARLGLPPTMIERAQALRSTQAQNIQALLARLDSQTRASAEQAAAIERERTQAAALLAQAQQELVQARAKAQETLSRAKAEAVRLVAEIRQAVSAEWERLRTSERSRRTLEASRKRITGLAAPLKVSEPDPEGTPPGVGDPVEVPHLGLKGTLVAQAGGTATVQAGAVTVRVPLEALRTRQRIATPEATGIRASRVSTPAKSGIPPELHLLGKTAEEAQAVVEKYLDDAFLVGLSEVRLVHGKGTGALRKAVHELLAVHPLVESFRPGEQYEGGSGATVVTLKVD
ncbi:MAG: endonuclease MutS2 [Candidatus Rokubacteria bacterium]|nr:endonuclease MutS2 [Candidatus Rokubacteria bacterium]